VALRERSDCAAEFDFLIDHIEGRLSAYFAPSQRLAGTIFAVVVIVFTEECSGHVDTAGSSTIQG
jgi:hypothetical protein